MYYKTANANNQRTSKRGSSVFYWSKLKQCINLTALKGCLNILFTHEKIKNHINGKKNAKQKEVEQQLLIVKQIAPMVTDGLKGNPRQIKRFLNTFTLRLELAEVAKFNLDEKILAKLMVLEYIALSRFKDLCDWQQMQNGKPKQLAEIENYAQKPTGKLSAELTSWDEDIILKWAKMLPSLTDTNLMDYYWISRDKLVNTIDAEAMIPQSVRLVHKAISTYTAQASLKSEVQKVGGLLDNERFILLNMIGRDLLEHPENERCYEIVHAIINCGYSDMMTIYKDTLQNLCSNKKEAVIPASAAIGMMALGKDDADFISLIKSFEGTTKIAKALGIQLKKQ